MGSQGETKPENLWYIYVPFITSTTIDCIKIQQDVLNDKDMYFSLICYSVGLATLHLSDKSETHFTRRGTYGEMTKLLPMNYLQMAHKNEER